MAGKSVCFAIQDKKKLRSAPLVQCDIVSQDVARQVKTSVSDFALLAQPESDVVLFYLPATGREPGAAFKPSATGRSEPS